MKTTEPYRLLFPLGAVIGIAAAGLWLLFAARWISFYPREAHANLMYFGFLWCFVAGFMMTAIPKMTGTSEAYTLEIALASLFGFLQVSLNIRNLTSVSVFLYGLQILFLMAFVLRRFFAHKRVPFAGFTFLPAAMGQAGLGVVLFFMVDGTRREMVTLLCGEAFLVNLILGLGSRLIPIISRLPNAIHPTEASNTNHWGLPVSVLLLVNVGYWLELAGWPTQGASLRVLGVVVGAIGLLRIFQRPMQWSMSGAGLKLGISLLVLGQVLSLFNFGSALAIRHLFFIGGFTLITFLVSTRVVLAHGGQSLVYEVRSKRLLMMFLLFAISAIFRALSGAQITGTMLTLSAVFFIFAIAIWFYMFLKVSSSPGFNEPADPRAESARRA